MTLLAAFHILLSRYSGQRDIAVGSPVAGRPRPELEALIGFFVDILVLRSHVSTSLTFSQFLLQVRETTLDAYANQDVPFEKLVEVLQPERDLSHGPLFHVSFGLQNAPQAGLQFGVARLVSFPIISKNAKLDITVNLSEFSGSIQGSLIYNTDLFDAATIERMIRHWQTMLSSLVAKPECPMSELALLTAEEYGQLTSEWNLIMDRQREFVHEMFSEVVRRQPEAAAITGPRGTVNYAQLNQSSSRVAAALRGAGISKGDLVADLCCGPAVHHRVRTWHPEGRRRFCSPFPPTAEPAARFPAGGMRSTVGSGQPGGARQICRLSRQRFHRQDSFGYRCRGQEHRRGDRSITGADGAGGE